MMHVVCWEEQLRDGREKGAKVRPDLVSALRTVEEMANCFHGRNMSFRVFELGQEVKLVEETVEVPAKPAPPEQRRTFRCA